MGLPVQVGKYEVLELIGRGGMGVVYKGRDNALGRPVALKVMTNDLAAQVESRTRFLREARSVSILQHPNIVVVYELGEHDGCPYIAMEFLEGEPLDQIIRRRAPISVLEKIDIILQVTKALHYAHDRGVIHRDIKPANIMRMRDGTVKVVDFGIAHLTDQTITRTGMVLGTPAYLAPEQLKGQGIDRRTDIFSLGVVLYELLSGNLPFKGASTAETMMKILLEPAPPLSQVGDVNPPELQQIVDKALAKKTEERFQTCSEMADALMRLRKEMEAQMQLAELGQNKTVSMGQLEALDIISPASQSQRISAGALAAKVASRPPPIRPHKVSATEMALNPLLHQSGRASVPQISYEEKKRFVKTRAKRLKWALAALAVAIATASLYPWLTRSRNSTSPSLPLMTSVGESAKNQPPNAKVTITPATARVFTGNALEFSAAVSGTNETELTWIVKEGETGGSVLTRDARPGGRHVSFRALYIAPNTPGTYHLVVSTKAEPHEPAIATVTVITPSAAPPKRQPPSDSPFQVR